MAIMTDGRDSAKAIEKSVIAVDYSCARILPQTMAALTASLGSLSIGMNLGWSSPVQPQLVISNGSALAEEDFMAGHLVLDAQQWSWVASLVTFGALLGTLTAGVLIDWVGRKATLLLTSAPYAVGWVLIIGAANPAMLYIGRTLNGISNGISSVAAPTYLVEITTPSVRGRLGSLYQMAMVSGIWLCSAVGVALSRPANDDWRWLSLVCAFVPFLLSLAVVFVPETPHWLLKKGRLQDARAALHWLRGPDHNTEDELAELQRSLKMEDAMAGRWSDLLQTWALKPFLVALGLMVIQQMCGTNNITFYMTSIFAATGSHLSPLISSLICTSVKLVMTVVSVSLMDVVGRRALLLISCLLTTVGMTTLGTFFYLNSQGTAQALSWLPMTAMILFIMGYSVGLGPVPGLLSSEILPRKIMAMAFSMLSCFNWALSFVVTKTFVDMQESFTVAGAYWFYGGCCAAGCLLVVATVPETKGKTYDQIQAIFAAGTSQSAGGWRRVRSSFRSRRVTQ